MPQTTTPEVSFIVAVHNRLDCTEVFLKSLLENTTSVEFELIFINDDSDDGSREFLDKLSDPRITVLHNETRLGYAKSVNKGSRLATGRLLGLVNNDLVLTPGWFEPMLSCFENHLRVGSVGNIQRNADTKSVDHAGIVFDLVGLPDHYGKNYPFLIAFEYREFPAVTAACMLIRRMLFEQMNGFNETYLNGCEDVDLCLRLRKAGYRNIVAGRSTVFHHVSASPGRRDNDKSNNRKLIENWGKEMRAHGQRDWPFQYLMRYWKKPWLFNGTKLLDAIARLMRLKSGDSKWAEKKRARIMDTCN